jgi:hypothetical protein
MDRVHCSRVAGLRALGLRLFGLRVPGLHVFRLCVLGVAIGSLALLPLVTASPPEPFDSEDDSAGYSSAQESEPASLLDVLRQEPGSIDPRVDSSRPSVVFLKTGRIISGRILRRGNDFIHHTDDGQVYIPGGLVEHWSQDMRALSTYIRTKLVPNNEVHERMKFATWCVQNGLLFEARSELRDALEAESDSDDLRKKLQRVERAIVLQAAAKKEADQSTLSARVTNAPSASAKAQTAEGLGGLTRETAREFTTRIQPVLVRNCAISGCHGGPTVTTFRIHRVSREFSATSIQTSENIETLRQYIDMNDPEASPLLTVTERGHGQPGRIAFDGPEGRKQFERLADWVHAVAQGERARLERRLTRKAGSSKKETNSDPDNVQASTRRGEVTTTIGGDPFDPDVFNSLPASGELPE